MTSKTQLVKRHITDKIHWQVYHANERIPSVRGLASQLEVSPYTVSQAYDELVAQGVIYAKVGAGYFVSMPKTTNHAVTLPSFGDNVLDTSWLLSHLFNDVPRQRASGSGLLPKDWLMPEASLRSASKKATKSLDYVYGYGQLQGYLGLREQFARQLADINIQAHVSSMLTTAGVSAGIEMIVRSMCQVGDYVLIDDPSWFWIIGCLQNLGMKVIGVKRTPDGVDLVQLEQLLEAYHPKLYITNSVLHNPTSYSITPPNAVAVLSLMQAHDCYIVEDDIYRDFYDASHNRQQLRYATLCGFNGSETQGSYNYAHQRVFYLGGVSKVLGGNWRVGIMCCPEKQLEAVLRQKMLINMTCPEITERIICHVWQDPAYARHISSLQQRIAKAHHRLIKRLDKLGLAPHPQCQPSLFIWVDVGVNTADLALAAHQDGWLVAPSHLFSPTGTHGTHIRLNVPTTSNEFLEWLRDYLNQGV